MGITLYIQNGRDSSKLKGYSPLQNCIGLIGMKHAIAHFAYVCQDAEHRQ